ncbi:MAG: hypothetical protein KAH77_00655 [Thiomargarita sp.]|nr:hypothetical protein [Thiomargarita sp.]
MAITMNLLRDLIAIKHKILVTLIFPVMCGIGVLLMFALNVSITENMLADIFQTIWKSVLQTSVALIIFLILFVIISYIITWIVSRFWRKPHIYSLFITLSIIGVMLLNSFPILYYLYLIDEHFLVDYPQHLFFAKVMILMLANGMLYYILSTAIFEMINETEKLYIISAEYKNTSVMDYVKEKLTWVILSQLSTIFYYLFSFTLFTDNFLESYASASDSQIGIIGYLFTLVIQKGWTLEAIVCLFSLLVVVLCIRLFCQMPLWIWKHRRFIEVA